MESFSTTETTKVGSQSNTTSNNGTNSKVTTTNSPNHLQNILNGLVSKLGIKQFTGSDIIQSHKSIQARALEVRKTKSSDSLNTLNDDLDNYEDSIRSKKKQKKRKLNFSPPSKEVKTVQNFSLDNSSFRSILSNQQPISVKILALQSMLSKPSEQPQSNFSIGSFSNQMDSSSNNSFGDLALLSQISTDSLASLITVSEELDSQSDTQLTDLYTASNSFDESNMKKSNNQIWKHEDFFVCVAERKQLEDTSDIKLTLDFSLPPSDWRQKQMTNVKSALELIKEHISEGDIKVLDIIGPMLVNDETLRIIADSLPNLQSLFIHFLLSAFVDFSLLESLSNQIEGQGIEYLLSKCTKLDYFYLNNCRKLKVLNIQSDSLRSLFILGGKSLELSCSIFSLPAIRVLDLELASPNINTILPLLLEGCPSLASLSLGCTSMADSALISSIFKCSKEISTLCFRNCKLITEASLNAVFSHLVNIVDLDISLCSFIDDKAMQHVVKLCPNLTTFRIGFHSSSKGITEEGAQLLMGLPYLKSLYFTTIGGACRGIKNLKFNHDKLELLDLTNCANIIQLSLICPKLEYLVLNGCNSVEISLDVDSFPALHTVAIDGIRKSRERYLRTVFKRHHGTVHFVTQL